MKKTEENRYPNSAELFKFCKEALNIKHNFEVKVIDQHVGSILSYDPADCSHWKKGKKNIKALQSINMIANQLEVDSNFVTDIVSGKIDLEESVQEYKGFGTANLSTKVYEELKREYFRNPARYNDPSTSETRTFEQVVDVQRALSLAVTQSLLNKCQVKTPPVMLPELLEALPNVRFEAAALSDHKLVETLTDESGTTIIRYRAGDMKPHVRYQLAREIGRVALKEKLFEIDGNDIVDTRLNVFASLLLVPGDILQIAAAQIDHTRDLIEQLAALFWVSRSVMNERLKDYFTHGN